MTIGRFVRGLVLVILWLMVAGFGLCSLIVSLGSFGQGSGWIALLCMAVVAVLIGVIWLFRKLTAPSQPPNP